MVGKKRCRSRLERAACHALTAVLVLLLGCASPGREQTPTPTVDRGSVVALVREIEASRSEFASIWSEVMGSGYFADEDLLASDAAWTKRASILKLRQTYSRSLALCNKFFDKKGQGVPLSASAVNKAYTDTYCMATKTIVALWSSLEKGGGATYDRDYYDLAKYRARDVRQGIDKANSALLTLCQQYRIDSCTALP